LIDAGLLTAAATSIDAKLWTATSIGAEIWMATAT
jgi:hypothetical protein